MTSFDTVNAPRHFTTSSAYSVQSYLSIFFLACKGSKINVPFPASRNETWALFLYSNPRKSKKKRGTFQLSLPEPVRPLPDGKRWQVMQLLHLCQAHVSERCLALHFPLWQTRTNRQAQSALLALLGNALVKYEPHEMLFFFPTGRISETLLCKVEKQGFENLRTTAFSASGLNVLLLRVWPQWHSSHFN